MRYAVIFSFIKSFLLLYMNKNKNIYIITEDVVPSGVNTWNDMILWYIKKNGIKCNLINILKTTDDMLLSLNNSVVIFNNIASHKIFNKYVFQSLHDKNNILYMVIHSELSPRNKLFVVLENYFSGAIAISQKLQQLLQKKYPQKDIIYIPNKINIKPHILDRNDDENILSFGFVGRISIEKNIPLLFYSFRKFLDEYASMDCILHIFGDTCNEKYGKYINKLAIDLKIDSFIEYHGHVSDKDEIYKDIDILLLPSISEGIPYCLVERSYYGIPVVASNIGAIDEIVSEDDGILFDYKNYPVNDNLYVNTFSDLLLNLGFVMESDDNCNHLTNDIKHICGKKSCKNIIYPDDKIIIPVPVSDINVEIYSANCPACEILKQSEDIFSENINRFTEAIKDCIKKMKHMNIRPIYENFDISIPIKNLIENSNKIKNIQCDISDTDSIFRLDTQNGKYGFYYNYNLRSLPYNIKFNIDLTGDCSLFICNKNSIMPYITKNVKNGDNNINFRITTPGYYKIGLQLSWSDNTVFKGIINNFELSSCESIIPSNQRIFFDAFDMKIINKSRYISENEISDIDMKDMLFMFITCELPKYKEKHDRLIDFLGTFNHNYIIVKSISGKTFYDIKSKTLIIDMEETYENLPRKIIYALKWILSNKDFNNIKYIYKLDNDFATNILSFIPKQYDSYDYYGNFIVNKFVDMWHIGKCNNSELNRTVYKNDFIAPYAGGGYGYILSRKSMEILVKNKNMFEEHLYEDKAIGDILYTNNIICNKKGFSTNINWVDNSIRVIEYKIHDAYSTCGCVIIYTYEKNMLLCVIENDKLIFQIFYYNIKDIRSTVNLMELECFNIKEQFVWNNKSCEPINEETIRISNKSKFKPSGIQLAYPPHQYDYLLLNHRCNILPLYLVKRAHIQNVYIDNYEHFIRKEYLKNIDYNEIFNYDIVYF